MNKLLLVLLSLLICNIFIYPQTLRKISSEKNPVTVKKSFSLNKDYKVSASSFTESFESATFPPIGWQVFNNDGGSGWTRETAGTDLPGWSSAGTISTPPSGGSAVAYCTYSNSGFNNQWIISPYIQDIQPLDTLFFWMRNQINVPDTIYIYYSLDGGNWVQMGHIYYPDMDPGTGWNKWFNTIGKSIPTDSSAFIAIREIVLDNMSNGGAISLDLFQIKASSNINAPAVVTNNATNITSSSAILNGTVNPKNLSTTVTFLYGTTTAYGSQVVADQSPVSGTADANVTAALTGLQPNTTYHFQLNAASTGGKVSGSDKTFTTTALVYPAAISLNHTFSFDNITQSNSYRMIGLPGTQSTKISDIVKGTQKKDWNAFYDNGSDTGFLKEFDGTANFNFSPGKGFWVLTKDPFTVNAANVPTVQISVNDNTFSIDLHNDNGGIAKFKIIASPFEKSVSWADIQNINGLPANDFLWDWTGVWNHAATMDPYKGYYYINANNLSSIKIPYNFNVGKIAKVNLSQSIYSGSFLKLSLLQNNLEKSNVVIGFNPSSKNDYDKFDSFAPPGYFDEVRIHIEDNNLSFPYKQLFVDYRPEINNGQTFNLKIKNTTKKIVTLIADGLNNFADEVYLVDENLNKFYNLKEKNEIDISPIHKEGNYKLLIGNENFINNIKKGTLPTEFNLSQNYPNPFNPSTIIKYQIPYNNTLVELRVYNILGKEVKTLVNQVQGQGIYEVELNSANLSSGVYFYSLNASSNGNQLKNFSAVKKMILLK